jgi:ATP-dependent protease ClpP protease subunit
MNDQRKDNRSGDRDDDQETNGSLHTTEVRSDGETIYCLTVIGQIEGHYTLPDGQKATRYEEVIPLLVSVEEDDRIDGILIVLNTMGGDVEAGLALSELIASMKKPTVTLVLGGGHSIGVPLAVCAKKSFIVPSATMTIHPVRINGLVIGVPQTYSYFEKMQNRIIDFIVRNSRADGDELRKLMCRTDELTTDIGTVLEGHEAVEKGIIDCVGGLGDAVAALKEMMRENAKQQEKS